MILPTLKSIWDRSAPLGIAATCRCRPKPSLTRHLTVAEIRGRSIMVHAGGDNFSDTPAPLGGGGARIAYGMIK
jgi:Cu-Zn family superoxide dismutase